MPDLFVARFWTARKKKLPIIRISVGKPRGIREEGVIEELAPASRTLKLPQEEFTKRYRARLEDVGQEKIEFRLSYWADKIGGSYALCCYEDLTKPGLWCHRTLFREWWYEQTGDFIYDVDEADPEPQQLELHPA